MRKKTPISDKDKRLFREATKGTAPLPNHDTKKVLKLDTAEESYGYRRQQASTQQKSMQSFDVINPTLLAEDKVFYAQDGVNHKQLALLKKGQYQWQARLDLHGYTIAQADECLKTFIEQCQQASQRYLMIVHGKGARSADDKPLIKNLVVQRLGQHPEVIAYSSAQPADGGTGALYVILKRQK